MTPDREANKSIIWDVGAAFFIAIPIPTTISGTKIIPPPIPKKEEIIPAKKLAPIAKTIICFEIVLSLVSIFFLKNMYAADAISTNPNKILKMSGATPVDITAPKTVPGIESSPSLSPKAYSIRFCLEYEIVDAVALLNAANRLLLAAAVGGNPKKVSIGTTIIPPPKPIMEPNSPAANPKGISHS